MIPARFQGAPTIAFSSLLFACMAAVARAAAGQMPVGQLAFVRMVTGLIVLVLVFFAAGRGPQLTRARLPLLFARGFLGGLSVVLYFVAIEQLEVGPATLLNNTAPAYAAVFAALFLREHISRRHIAGLLVAMSGAALVIYSTLEPGRSFHLGVGAAAGLLSAVLSGAAMTTMRALRKDTDTLTVLFSFVLLGSLVTLPPAVIGQTLPASRLVLHAILVGVLAVAAQLLLTNAFRYVSASVGSATTQLTTVFSWSMGVIFLGESIRPLGVLGALICIGGVSFASGFGTGWLAARDSA